jgi:hypothetical protein
VCLCVYVMSKEGDGEETRGRGEMKEGNNWRTLVYNVGCGKMEV